METAEKKRRIVLIVLCVAIVLAGASAGVLVWENRVERQFPMWCTPCWEPEEKDIDPNVSLRFSGIDFEVPNATGALCDRILMKAIAPANHSIMGTRLAWVDYWYKGEWHTVWCNGYNMEIKMYGTPKATDEEISIEKNVSAGLFVRDGQYRLFMDGLGYCDIDITGIDSMK